jgi:hypothetical protein
MRAQPPAPTSSPWPQASGANPRGQSGQRLGDPRVASFAKTFLLVVVCGMLFGYGLAYLLPNSSRPTPGAGAKMQPLPLAIAAGSTADEAAVPVSRLPTPAVEIPPVKLAHPALAVATPRQPSAHPRWHRPRVAQRGSRQPAAQTRLGTWLRQAREKIMPRRWKANGTKQMKKKASPCKCAVNPTGFSPAILTA